MKVPVFYHDSSLRHDTGAHPENAARVEVTLDHLHSLPGGLDLRSPRAATEEDLLRVHSERHVARVREVADAGGGSLDPDTIVSPDSYDAALYAAGAVLSGIDAVLDGDAPAAFALVRPPGHHARRSVAMGFCLFNNVAVGARYLIAEKGLGKVAIIDWDVHHGNGTQETFYGDGSVFYLSLHRHPFYPGTGLPQERGEGPGEGTTLNVPLGALTPPEEYVRIFGDALGELASFRPEFVIISAGFDAYRDDPIAGLNLGVDDFGALAAGVRSACADARGIVSSLEGGYHLEALPGCVAAHLRGLDG